MSEVTAKDLRKHVEQCYYLAKHGYLTPERDEKRKKYLAAFDAMAEKAEAYDRAEQLAREENECYRGFGVYADHINPGHIVVNIDNKRYTGETLAHALKAVQK